MSRFLSREMDASNKAYSWDLRVSHMDTGRLSTIRALIEHPNITLYSLNASDEAFDGFTPLGMASWLNQPEAVSLLLRGSLQTVSVDGLDAQAATPLMCMHHSSFHTNYRD